MNVTLNDEEERAFRQLTILLDIIKALGWEDISDTRIIKPNMRRAQLFIRKNYEKLMELFPEIQLNKLSRQDVVDTINPLLIQMWHIQIIGEPTSASLERLYKK